MTNCLKVFNSVQSIFYMQFSLLLQQFFLLKLWRRFKP